MASIIFKAQKLALSIKKSIKGHYLGDASLIKILYEDKYDCCYDDELEDSYYLTYKD